MYRVPVLKIGVLSSEIKRVKAERMSVLSGAMWRDSARELGGWSPLLPFRDEKAF